MSLSQGLTELVAPVLEKAGFRLWDLKVTKAGKRSIVSVTLDKTGGVSIEDIAAMSKVIAPLLDEHAALDDAYHLEVASPGLERPLSRVEHFEWSLGMNVTISHRVDGSLVRSRGRLVVAAIDNVTLETDDGGSELIAIDSITKAHTLFDFDEAMKKGPLASISDEETESEDEDLRERAQ